MAVNINFKQDLFINAETARDLSLDSNFDILFTANLLEEGEEMPTYPLEEVMARALEYNFGIKISPHDIMIAIQDARLAKTAALPSLNLGVNASQINEESATAQIDRPERLLAGQLTLDQLIFSEQSFAGIKIAYYLQQAQEFATEAEILEVLLNTYFDYFGLLAAKTVLAIEEGNLENLKTNLELARFRVNLGSASRAEIFRWESEVATANQVVVEANTNLLSARYQLNTSLANTLENQFDIEDVTIDGEIFRQLREDAIAAYINNPKDVLLLVDFLIEEAVSNNPNKQAILQQINAAERLRLQNKRLFYTPNIGLSAQTQQKLWRGGTGSVEMPTSNFQDNTWSVGIGLSYPIFAANTRSVQLQSAKVQLEQLENARMQLDQQLELAIRTSTLSTIAATTNLDFSRISTENADANFELVQDRYEAGEVNITQLIDAQQSALRAKQRYAVAVYDYIQAQLQLEFAVGFFSMFATEEQIQAFEQRFLDFRANR
jgi:outer membrane protein TolC